MKQMRKGASELKRVARPQGSIGLVAGVGAILAVLIFAAPALGSGTFNLGYPWSSRTPGTSGYAPCSGYDHYSISTVSIGGLVQGTQDTKSTNSIACSSNSAQRIQYADGWGSSSSGVLWSPPSTGYYSFGYLVDITLYSAWAQIHRCLTGNGWYADFTISLYGGVYDSSTGKWILSNQYNQIASMSTDSGSCVSGYVTVTLGSSYPVWSNKAFSWTFPGSLYLYSNQQYESDLGVQLQTDTNAPYNGNGYYAEAVIFMGDPQVCPGCGDYFQYITV